MANFNVLKAAIDAVIKANGQQEITGPILNAVLKAIVDSLGAGFELAGVATPSTNPGTPDQDVYWLAYQGGTYTNFGGAVLPTGISMLKWDGSWTSQTFFTVDDQLTPNSSNLAKSGAAFDAVMQGGVFDLSAHNGGATYADLSAALTALNMLPAAYKRGGMSFKFVSTSDNRYVQFRYMGSSTAVADFTNVANWQNEGLSDVIGQSALIAMSQKAVTDELNKKEDKILINQVNISKILSSLNIDSNKDLLYVTDGNGNVVLKLDSNGLNYVGKCDIYNNYNNELYITDGNGNVALKLDSNGLNYIGKGDVDIENKFESDNDFADPIQMSIVYGQSLACSGSLTGNVNFYGGLMFKEGAMQNYTYVDDPTQVANFYGQDFVPISVSGVSTPVKYMAREWLRRCVEENKIDISTFDYSICIGNPSAPGAPWQQLAYPDGVQYKRLLQSVTYAKKFANARGKGFSVGSLAWMQGESSLDKWDTTKMYYDKLWIVFSNLNHDIKQITGQTEDVLFIVYQRANHDVINFSIGQTQGTIEQVLSFIQLAIDGGEAPVGYELSEVPSNCQLKSGASLINRDNIVWGCPLYQNQAASNLSTYLEQLRIYEQTGSAAEVDMTHQASHSYSMIGTWFGIQSKRALVDGNKVLPIYPKTWKIIQTTDKYLLDIEFDVPVPPLKFRISDIRSDISEFCTNYGFSILNGQDIEIIESVVVSRGTHVIITCTENPSGLQLYYAKHGILEPGNLADSQGDKIKTVISGNEYRVDNWAPIFRITI